MSDFKYFLEDHKKTIFSTGGIIAGIGLLGGVFMFVNYQNHKNYDETAGPKVILAEHLIVQSEKGDLDLFNVEDNKKVDTLSISDNTLISRNQQMDAVFVYDKDNATISEIVVEKDKMTLETIKTVKNKSLKEQLITANDFTTNENDFAFISPEKTWVVDESEKVIETDDELANANAMSLTDTNLYLAKKDKIYSIDLESGKQSEIEVGDTTTELNAMGNYMMAHNEFGSDLGKSIVLRLKKDSLHIEELKQFDTNQYLNVSVPSDENQLVMLNIKKDTNDEVLKQELIIMNAVGTKDEEKPFVLNLSTDGDFTKQSVLASNGYLYNIDTKSDEVSITELRNGREYRSISVETKDENPFFIPIYKK